MIEHIGRIAEVEKSLQKLGVKPEAIEEVARNIEEYATLKEGIGQAREKQFEEDAYTILVPVQSASNKAVKALSIGLRKFAEHVVRHTLQSEHRDNIQRIVDHIPQMSDMAEERSV